MPGILGINVLDISLRANANLDTTTADHVAVYVSGSMDCDLRSTITQIPIGILQNGGIGGVLSGAMATVRALGVSKLQQQDSLGAGIHFRISSLGLAIPLNNATVTIGNQFIGGICLRANAGANITGAMATVLWAPFAAARSDSSTAA